MRTFELMQRLAVPVGTLLFLPFCLLLGWTIRVWDLEVGYWLSLRRRILCALLSKRGAAAFNCLFVMGILALVLAVLSYTGTGL